MVYSERKKESFGWLGAQCHGGESSQRGHAAESVVLQVVMKCIPESFLLSRVDIWCLS